jgi:excisionase family DNA binding protein
MKPKNTSEAPTLGKRLVNAEEIAPYIGTTAPNIYQMVSKNQIPFVKIGRSTRFDLLKINAWIAENTHEIGCRE